VSWREEMRQDRLVRAQIDRDRAAAAADVRIAERQAAASERREDAHARAAARDRSRRARADRRAAVAGWLRSHVIDLLFVPVIVVPGVLAWTAMSAYGHGVYGLAGWLLPAFSEGAMWAFAAAVTLTLRLYPGRPVWHLRAGTWVFAAVAAALNFTHGLTGTAGTGPHRLGTGVVMALVSVAGVTAHQLVTAGPRRTRADRHHARLAKVAARRELAVRRAAVRGAVARLDSDGNARLVYRPAVVTLSRRRGRTRLIPAIVPGLPVTPAGDGTDWDAALAALAESGDAAATGVTAPGQAAGDGTPGGGGVAVADPPGNTATLADLADLAEAAIAAGQLPPAPSQRALRDLLGIRMARAALVQRLLTQRKQNP
jgi:hypothetical protein